MNKILVLAPHTDDESLGCGGTISRMKYEDRKIFIYCFSSCASDILFEEYYRVADLFDVNVRLRNYTVRNFHEHRQTILQELIDLEFNGNTVLIPSSFEVHRDHQIINQEAIRAFKHCTILGYELPWNNIESKHQCTIPLTEEQVNKKIEACSMYKSQAHRPYMNPEFIKSWAKMRGVQNGCEYAEVFEVIKLRL